MLNYNEYIELINERRSIRSFTDQVVSKEDIMKIIDEARYAPSGMNFQPWEFVVITNPKLITESTSINLSDLKIPKIIDEYQIFIDRNKIIMDNKYCTQYFILFKLRFPCKNYYSLFLLLH